VRSSIKDGYIYRLDFPTGALPPGRYRNSGVFRQHEADCLERLRVYAEIGAFEWPARDATREEHPYIQPLHAVVKLGKKCLDMFA
jgi:hypothetical protein